jgi:hypothetical protein
MRESGVQFTTEARSAMGALSAPPGRSHNPVGCTARAFARGANCQVCCMADCQVGSLSSLRTPDPFGHLRPGKLGGAPRSDLGLEASTAFFWRLFPLGGSLIVKR